MIVACILSNRLVCKVSTPSPPPTPPLTSMVKENSPPPAKTGSPPRDYDLSPLLSQADNEMSDEDKAASDNVGRFLAAIPPSSCFQFLVAISSNEFLKSFTAIASNETETFQVKFEKGMVGALKE